MDAGGLPDLARSPDDLDHAARTLKALQKVRDGRPSVARRFRADFSHAYASFFDFLERWDRAAIESRPAEFAAATRAAMSALAARVRLENDVLYQALDEAEARGG